MPQCALVLYCRVRLVHLGLAYHVLFVERWVLYALNLSASTINRSINFHHNISMKLKGDRDILKMYPHTENEAASGTKYVKNVTIKAFKTYSLN